MTLHEVNTCSPRYSRKLKYEGGGLGIDYWLSTFLYLKSRTGGVVILNQLMRVIKESKQDERLWFLLRYYILTDVYKIYKWFSLKQTHTRTFSRRWTQMTSTWFGERCYNSISSPRSSYFFLNTPQSVYLETGELFINDKRMIHVRDTCQMISHVLFCLYQGREHLEQITPSFYNSLLQYTFRNV